MRSAIGYCSALLALVVSPVGAQSPIINPDSTYSFDLPDEFIPVQLNTQAELQFADTVTESFFMTLKEDKEDLFGWNLTRHSTVTLAQMVAVTDFPELTPAEHLEVAGLPAVRYELKGVSGGMQIAYQHATIELPSSFLQILMWTRRSLWDQHAPKYRTMLESFAHLGTEAASSTSVFDIVPGTWAWTERETGCASDTQTFTISEDRTRMTITNSEPFERADGEMATVTEYVIEGATETVLNTYIPTETRLTDAGEPVKWDLVVVARNRLAWHRTDWVEGAMTGALQRCAASS